ncbi:MAG: hypothetical protein C7B45_16315 [Sulfobacillus acidophilus]|uniref:Uncharacterized protein n=1 Tax=Sulfobacillus acidophilus TaxID=53633 RepID=A0A2T2WD29_9FIRM|nr:MAG: hypothetical protein C7B45_16315 [Sulfobacillus acidophilus]
MLRPVTTAATAALMVLALTVLTQGFRDLPLDERPEWLVVQMVLWPVLILGMVEGVRLLHYASQGYEIRVDRLRLILHGLPALAIVVLPAGQFTSWFGAHSIWAQLDLPTAKVMAAFWLAATLWASWEVRG